jgi:subtilisin family serine protease
MARRLIGVGALALSLAVPPVASAGGYGRPAADSRFVPGEALVRYAAGTDAGERRQLRSAASVDFGRSLLVPRTQVVSFRGPVGDAIERLENQPGVVDAQPNYVYHALALAPNDLHFGDLWGLSATPGVAVLPAWDRSRGAGQVIAIVDTGVDLTHPDLAGNLWTGPGGIHGHDFVDNDNDPDDFNMHGTHVAGTAAAISDNAQGVAGVAPQAQIMAVRVLDGDGLGSTTSIANGIVFAAANGAGVINLSLGAPAGPGDAALAGAISQAEQRNAVVVAAAGNEANNNDVNPSTPCALPNGNVICVAAVTLTGARSDFSNFGATTVDLGAPGGDGSGTVDGDILSAKPAWAPLFSEDFESGSDGWTASGTSLWGLADSGIGTSSATDSPPGLYANNTNSEFQHSAVNLSGGRGCRLDYRLRLSGIEDALDPFGDFVDFVGVGVLSGGGDIGQDFAGDTSGDFERVEMSITALDGRSDVQPTFFFTSDDSVTGDGAYVDNFKIMCRGSSYPTPSLDDIAGAAPGDGGAYTPIAGTSMAAPHVAGVAALVRAVDPGAPPSQVVQALRKGAKPVAGMAGVTATGGVVDAVGAMDAALALPNTQPPPPPAPQPQPPAKPRLSGIRFNARRGVLRMVVRSTPDVTGVVTLRANITAARVRVVGRRAFAIGTRGRATVRIKLRKRALKQLRRKRRLSLSSMVAIRNSAGLRASTRRTIRLRLRRR